jgi:hypothetical protein
MPQASPAADELPHRYYTDFVTHEGQRLRPCLTGAAGCEPGYRIEYTDGTSNRLDEAIGASFAMVADGGQVTWELPICREERGSLLAEFTALRAELLLWQDLGEDAAPVDPVDLSLFAWEPCDTTLPTASRFARVQELASIVTEARTALAAAKKHLAKADGAVVAADGDRLVELGMNLVRRAARDASYLDTMTAQADWQSARHLAADMVLAGLRLRHPTAATTAGTRDLLDAVIKVARDLDDQAMLRSWR